MFSRTPRHYVGDIECKRPGKDKREVPGGRVALQHFKVGCEIACQEIFADLHEHGEAHKQHHVQAGVVWRGEDEVPDVRHLLELVLLSQQKRDPPERVELRVHLGGEREVLPQGAAVQLEERVEAVDDGFDAAASGVQLLAERVAEVAHDLHKAKESVRFGVRRHERVRICAEQVIQRRQELIHALHISQARVQFRKNEKRPLELLPVL
mmetsp:Transcript_30677/g.51659  ORF Transcript_30677/g.51659 Transcript_30677/m.51659 type:complete len:209 (-) Transcript_30677:848-1474(-)